MDAAVALVKSYLELGGYFVLAEIPVRTETETGFRDVTDLDILGVRFPRPWPEEHPDHLEWFLGTDPSLKTAVGAFDVIIGEVKEGAAHVNPALRRQDTIAFALRRVACCPPERVAETARAVTRHGRLEMAMRGGQRCVIRVVAFAAHGARASGAALTISLGRCAEVVSGWMHEARDLLVGAQLKDPVLGVFALQEKLAPTAGGAS